MSEREESFLFFAPSWREALASGESALAMPRIVGLLLSCHAVRALVEKNIPGTVR